MNFNTIINDNNIKDFLIIFFISMFTLKFNYKILDLKEKSKTILIYFFILVIIDIIVIALRNGVGIMVQIISLLMFIALIFSNKVNGNIGYSIMITTISISTNYIICIISSTINFFIFRLLPSNTYIVLLGTLII